MKNKLKRLLLGVVPNEVLSNVYGSFDIVGDIAIIRLTDSSRKYAEKIADAVMAVHGNVRTVLAQTSAVCGDFRLRQLDYITGENRTRTVHRESGCHFSVDLEKCYFSPRLSHERSRIASLVQTHETVVNMFAGVGCFSIIIAKQVESAKVYCIDVNPDAFRFMTENVRLNRIYRQVIPILGDAKTVIENQLTRCADRVLMPLPEKAFDYLPWAASAVKPLGGWIHVYIFEHAAKTKNPVEKTRQKLTETLDKLNVGFEIAGVRLVRPTGPNWWQLVADVHVGGTM